MMSRNPMARNEQRKPFEVIQRETTLFLSSAAAMRRKLQDKRVLS